MLHPTIEDTILEEEWRAVLKANRDELIRAINQPVGRRFLHIDYFDLSRKSEILWKLLDQDARRVYAIGQLIVDEVATEWTDPNVTAEVTLTISSDTDAFKQNLGQPISGLGEHHRGKLQTSKATIRQIGPMATRCMKLAYHCVQCDGTFSMLNPYSFTGKHTNANHPNCELCGEAKKYVQFVEQDSTFENFRVISVSQPFGDTGGNSHEFNTEVVTTRDLAQQVQPGEEVQITYWRDHEQDGNKNLFLPFLVATDVQQVNAKDRAKTATEEDLQTWKSLVDQVDIHQAIIDTVSPNFYGAEHRREVLACTLFASRRSNNQRGDLNILLIGDPGAGKSQLLGDLHRAAPKGVMTNGKGSTNAGLTASAIRNDRSGAWTVEAGALPLSNLGHCFIDELDKADKDQVEALHEAMEQQVISVNKAGINTQLPAQASVVCGANPKHGRWDPNTPIADQLDIMPTILSRFDAILLFNDTPDPKKDEEVANVVLGETGKDTPKELTLELIQRVSWWARNNLEVTIPPDVKTMLVEAYQEARKASTDGMRISPRQLGSIRRFAEARARMHLRDEVTRDDARWAIDTVHGWIKKVAGHHGIMDIDFIQDPGKASQRQRARDVMKVLRDTYMNQSHDSKGVSLSRFLEGMKEKGYKDRDRDAIMSMVAMLKQEGAIIEAQKGFYQPVD